MSLVAAVAGDGGGSGVLAPHLAPNLRRARDRVHLARVPRARGVRGLQRARGTFRYLLQVQKLYLGFIIRVQIDYLYFILQLVKYASLVKSSRATRPAQPFCYYFLD